MLQQNRIWGTTRKKSVNIINAINGICLVCYLNVAGSFGCCSLYVSLPSALATYMLPFTNVWLGNMGKVAVSTEVHTNLFSSYDVHHKSKCVYSNKHTMPMIFFKRNPFSSFIIRVTKQIRRTMHHWAYDICTFEMHTITYHITSVCVTRLANNMRIIVHD